MERELTKFWRDVADAYTQVSLNHSREISIVSDAEDLTAFVVHDNERDITVIGIGVGSGSNTHLATKQESEANN